MNITTEKISKHKQQYPWKSPFKVVCFVLALVFAFILTINMPVVQKKKWSYNTTNNSMIQENKENKIATSPNNTPNNTIDNTINNNADTSQNSITDNINPFNQKRISNQDKAASQDNTAEQDNLANNNIPLVKKSLETNFESQERTDSTEIMNKENQKNIETTKKQDAFDKIISKSKRIGKLLLIVGIAAFLGGLIEARSWHLYLGYFLRRVTRAARLPEIIGISMPIALYSNTSANSLLMSSSANGAISTSALITGGMANSYLAHISHSLRVMYPVIALIGLPGLLFFTVQFSGGFLIILIAFCINRYKCRHLPPETWASELSVKKEILDWKKSINLGLLRALSLMFRMVYITLPLMLAMEWMLKSGAFDFWEQHIPSQVAKYFPVELISIVVSQIGGLVQSASISAHLLSEGLIHPSQVLLAMLVASAIGNPIRALRRNLPTALGVYPPKVAFTIVFTMQLARFIVTMLGSLGVILWMNYFLF